jgi:acyl transferase domain-containing protein
LDSNESTIDEQCYRKVLTKDEYYLRDHIILGAKILPGAAYLEMTRVAAELGSGGRKMQRVKDVQWQQALRLVGEKTEVRVSLFPAGERIEFEVSSGSGNGHGDNIHAVGSWEPHDDKTPLGEQLIDLEGIRGGFSKRLSAEQCYQMFSEIGLLYGPSFRVIQELQYGVDECLAVLELPVELRDKVSQYVLHPTLLDGAFQSVIGLMLDPDERKLFIPFSVQELTISGPLQSTCYAFARRLDRTHVGVREFDIALADQHGRILVSIERFAVHEVRMKGMSSHQFMSEGEVLKVLQLLEDGKMSEGDVLNKLGVHEEGVS